MVSPPSFPEIKKELDKHTQWRLFTKLCIYSSLRGSNICETGTAAVVFKYDPVNVFIPLEINSLFRGPSQHPQNPKLLFASTINTII